MSTELLSLIISAGVSTFISGVTVGRYIGNIKSIDSRLSRIEGMFTMVLKSDLTITHNKGTV